MMCLLDVGMLTLDVAAWNMDRQRCLRPMLAMADHEDWLLRYRVGIFWSDDFFEGFPWNQSAPPPEMIDYCGTLMQFYSHMQANGLLLSSEYAPDRLLPIVVPDPVTAPHVSSYRELWLRLLAGMVCHEDALEDGVAVPTWERPDITPHRELVVQNATLLNAFVDRVPLLKDEAECQAFTRQFHKPDLSGVRIAVLGGQRAAFERASQQLKDAYNAAECLRLPPHYEENRSQQVTQQRLSQTDLLVICTNRLKHSDTEQIKNIEEAGSLTCAVVRISSDSADQIIQAVTEHYRT